MKKYIEDDIKALTKAQVIEKLTEEGVTFDANQKKDELVNLLLEVEVPDQESPENNEVKGASTDLEEKDQLEEQVKEPEEDTKEEPEQEIQEVVQTIEPGPSDSVLEAEKKLAAMQTGKTADHAAFEAALSARSGNLPAKGTFEDELAKRRGDKLKKISFGEALAARLRNVRNK